MGGRPKGTRRKTGGGMRPGRTPQKRGKPVAARRKKTLHRDSRATAEAAAKKFAVNPKNKKAVFLLMNAEASANKISKYLKISAGQVINLQKVIEAKMNRWPIPAEVRFTPETIAAIEKLMRTRHKGSRQWLTQFQKFLARKK